jgi:RNA polymerase sigma factor (sigma-70 family)
MKSTEYGRDIEGILDAVKAGDARATDRLYARLWPLVFGYCYHRLRQAESAEEAAQDAVLEVMRRVPEIVVPDALWRYSCLVAAKHCDRRTRKKSLGTVSDRDLADGRRRDPLSEFLEQEERRRVMDALWSLAPRLRVALVLYYLHEYRTGEIAAFLGTSVEAVKKRLSDGRARLKENFMMIEGVLRDFGALVKMGNRNLQRLLRELADEDLAHVLHVVAPELRAKLERNVSGRTLERLKAVAHDDERATEAVRRFWNVIDKMLEIGEIDLGPGEDAPEAATPVAAMVSGPGTGEREAWLRQVFHELSLKARRYGLFALEHDAERCDDPLLKKGIEAVVDGMPPEGVRARLREHGTGGWETLVEEGILAIQQGELLERGPREMPGVRPTA